MGDLRGERVRAVAVAVREVSVRGPHEHAPERNAQAVQRVEPELVRLGDVQPGAEESQRLLERSAGGCFACYGARHDVVLGRERGKGATDVRRLASC